MEEAVVNEREKHHAERLVKDEVHIKPAWFKHNTLFTLFLNASSVGIPDAERFIISTVTEYANTAKQDALKESIQTLIHEESAHSRVHDAYNNYLRSVGFRIDDILRREKKLTDFLLKHFSLKTRLAFCAITEHFTAIMAKQILDTGILEGEDIDERMDRVWTWHALEELDHRATAFDLYLAAGGGYVRRVLAGLLSSALFLYMQQTCFFSLMSQKNALFNLQVWKRGMPFLFGTKGIYRHLFTDWLRFFKPGFHPSSLSIRNALKKQLHHYHIESELISYFKT